MRPADLGLGALERRPQPKPVDLVVDQALRRIPDALLELAAAQYPLVPSHDWSTSPVATVRDLPPPRPPYQARWRNGFHSSPA
jgi:hypothetical protein